MTTPSLLKATLAELLNLDEPTVSSQIWPLLSRMKSGGEVREYLFTLLGNEAPQRAFVDSYITARFPPPTTPAAATTKNDKPWGGGAAPTKVRPTVDLEKEFAGGGGKVYVKNRDDDLGLGGRRSKAGSRGASPVPPPPAPPAQAQKQRFGATAKGKEKEELVLSEGAAKEVVEIERLLSSFEVGAVDRRCFCQARQHPLSAYTPLCPSCALVLCSLHPPPSPCPSCSFSPLLSPTSISSHISLLHTRREDLVRREKERMKKEREEEERERAAIRFPELGNEGGKGRSGGMRGYSSIAGGGGGLEERIERGFTAASGGAKVSEIKKEEGPRKVLRLDSKTKKVVVQTRVVKKESGKDVVVGEKVAKLEGDGLVGWIDENDDGVRKDGDGKESVERKRGMEVKWVEERVIEEVKEVVEMGKERDKGVVGAGMTETGNETGKNRNRNRKKNQST